MEQEEKGNSPNIALTRDYRSASISETYLLPYSTGIVGYDKIGSESPLEAERTRITSPSAQGGNVLQRRSGRSKSINSADLERGSMTGNNRNSTLPQDAEKYQDSSSQTSLDEEAVISVVETSQRAEDPNTMPCSNVSLHSSLPRRDESISEPELQVPELFHAFPEAKWFRSTIFAVAGFCTMTMIVLGNLIYTYIPSILRVSDWQNCSDCSTWFTIVMINLI